MIEVGDLLTCAGFYPSGFGELAESCGCFLLGGLRQPSFHYVVANNSRLLKDEIAIAENSEVRYALNFVTGGKFRDVSVSTFITTARPARSDATRATSGAAIRQGPHQAAQKSTRTGTRAFLMMSSKDSRSAAIGSQREEEQLCRRRNVQCH